MIFPAHEHKLGSILGRDKSGILYGINRNQKTYLKYNKRFGEYLAITKSRVPNDLSGVMKDLSEAKYLEMPENIDDVSSDHKIEVDTGYFAGICDKMLCMLLL